MDIVSNLFQQYSIESIILIIIALGIAIKFVGELIEWFYNKTRKFFNKQNDKDKENAKITDGISTVDKKVSQLLVNIGDLTNRVKVLEEQGAITTERLQENSRSYIIDKHHYFCYDVKAIDDLNLQSLERRYLYYKAAGGNSYIEGLMEEIRDLPKVNLQDRHIIEAVQQIQ